MEIKIEFKVLRELEKEIDVEGRELSEEEQEKLYGLLEEHLDEILDDAMEDLKLTENEELTWSFK